MPMESVLQGESYFDPRGPLDPSWRKGDSIWSLVPAAGVQAAERAVREMVQGGTLEDYVSRHDAPRRDVGQFTYFSAVRA